MIWFLFLAAFFVGCAGNPWLTAAFMVALIVWALHTLGVLHRPERAQS